MAKFPNKQAEKWFKKGVLYGLNAMWAIHDDMEGHLIRMERNFDDGELQEMLARDEPS